MTEIDIHSTNMDSMKKYGNILYPHDRYLEIKREERYPPEFLVPCSIEKRNDGRYINFYGFYDKNKLIELLDMAKTNGGIICSKSNNEFLLAIPAIPDNDLKELFVKCERNENNS